MPGKQMAIDADLNTGAITEKEARERRNKIQEESAFFGSMDGATKYVKGDATAGLIITFIGSAATTIRISPCTFSDIKEIFPIKPV